MSRYKYAQLIQISAYVCWVIFVLIGIKVIKPLPSFYFVALIVGLVFTARCRQCGLNIFFRDQKGSGNYSMDSFVRPNKVCPRCQNNNAL